MSDYIKSVAALLHLVKTMTLGRLLLVLFFLLMTPVLIAIAWKLPEIILALK